MSIIAFFFIFLLLILFFIFSVGFSIIGKILRLFIPSSRKQSDYSNRSSQNQAGNNNTREKRTKQSKKVFNKEDGEYVDYEEIK